MNLYWRAILLVLMAGISRAAEVPAELPVAVRAQAYTSYTDNLFQNANRRSDWITSARIDLDYTLQPNLDLYYVGNTRVFAEYDDAFNHTHHLGLSYAWSGNKDRIFYAGLNASTRRNRSVYQYRNYVQGNAYITGKLYLQPELLSRLGYQLQFRKYDYMPDFSFSEQILFAQLNRFLPTKTTLQGVLKLGVKSFLHSTSTDYAISGLTPRAGGSRNLAQLTLRLKVAQTLASNTGLQIEYQHRRILASGSHYIDLDYNPDEDLFRDLYSHEGDEWRSTLKYVRSKNLRISITGRSARERYDIQPALDLDRIPVGAMREDRRNSLLVEATRTYPLSGSWVHSLQLQLGWYYADINSNVMCDFLDLLELDQSIQVERVSFSSDIEPHTDGMGQDLGDPQIVQMPGIADLERLDVKAFNELGIDGFDQSPDRTGPSR